MNLSTSSLFLFALVVTTTYSWVPSHILRPAFDHVVKQHDPFSCPQQQQQQQRHYGISNLVLQQSSSTGNENSLTRVSEEDEGVPIPFIDADGNSFIECYGDSVADVDGVLYTIGVPCDHSVALCYLEGDNLVPVELNDSLMDDIFPVAENIVSEEFGDELVLQRTPQTLTLVGELDEEDEDDDDDELDHHGNDEDDDDEDDDDEEEFDLQDSDEEVEVLLSFEHRGKEFNLVRLIDPILLVGKTDPERPDLRVLLTPEESENIMPILEEMFLEFHEDRDSMLP